MGKLHADSRNGFIQGQKRILEAKQRECMKQRKQALNALAAIEDDDRKDSVDLASAVMHQEENGKRANDCTEEFIKINQAILNIANGTYGLCDGCEEEISVKRLKAIPWATKCTTCQQAEELQE